VRGDGVGVGSRGEPAAGRTAPSSLPPLPLLPFLFLLPSPFPLLLPFSFPFSFPFPLPFSFPFPLPPSPPTRRPWRHRPRSAQRKKFLGDGIGRIQRRRRRWVARAQRWRRRWVVCARDGVGVGVGAGTWPASHGRQTASARLGLGPIGRGGRGQHGRGWHHVSPREGGGVSPLRSTQMAGTEGRKSHMPALPTGEGAGVMRRLTLTDVRQRECFVTGPVGTARTLGLVNPSFRHDLVD